MFEDASQLIGTCPMQPKIYQAWERYRQRRRHRAATNADRDEGPSAWAVRLLVAATAFLAVSLLLLASSIF